MISVGMADTLRRKGRRGLTSEGGWYDQRTDRAPCNTVTRDDLYVDEQKCRADERGFALCKSSRGSPHRLRSRNTCNWYAELHKRTRKTRKAGERLGNRAPSAASAPKYLTKSALGR